MKNKQLFILVVLMVCASSAAPVRSSLSTREIATTAAQTIPTAKDYIQDGLIAMWDGIENAGEGVHDENATNWVDLTGNGLDLTLASNVNFSVNGIVKNGTITQNGHAWHAGARSKVLALGGIATIEGVLTDTPNYRGDEIWISSTYCNCPAEGLGYVYSGFGRPANYSTSVIRPLGGRSGSYRVPCKDGIMRSFSYSRTKEGINVFVDGYSDKTWEKTDASQSELGGGAGTYENITIAGNSRNHRNLNILKICHFRLYNRALTEEEIKHNYAIDKARFNLP